MLSMSGKRFGLRATLGAVALGLGLAGAAVSVSTPAKADGWHHYGWHGGYYGGWHGWYGGPRVVYNYGYPYYYPRPRVYYPPAYTCPPAYYPYGGVTVTVPIR